MKTGKIKNLVPVLIFFGLSLGHPGKTQATMQIHTADPNQAVTLERDPGLNVADPNLQPLPNPRIPEGSENPPTASPPALPTEQPPASEVNQEEGHPTEGLNAGGCSISTLNPKNSSGEVLSLFLMIPLFLGIKKFPLMTLSKVEEGKKN